MGHFVGQAATTNGVTIALPYAYLAEWNGFRVLDVSNPTNPIELSFIDGQGSEQDVALYDHYACVSDCWSGGIRIIDVSDPSSPFETGFCAIDGCVKRVAVLGDQLYAAVNRGGMVRVNISNPFAPQIQAQNDDIREASDVAIADTMAFLLAESSGTNDIGLEIFGTSTSMQLSTLGFFEPNNELNSVVSNDALAIVGQGKSGMHVIDVSDPSHPLKSANFYTPGGVNDVMIDGNLAYIVDDLSGLHVVDLSDPTIPQEIGELAIGDGGQQIARSGDLIYVTSQQSGPHVIDISDPHLPVNVTQFAQGYGGIDVAVSASIAYVSFQDSLRIFDISNPASLVQMSAFYLVGYQNKLTLFGNFLIATDRQIGFRMLDVSDPRHPTLVREYQIDREYLPIINATLNQFVISFGRPDFFWVSDYTNPLLPHSLGHYRSYYDLSPGDLAVSGDIAYATKTGFFSIYDISAALTTPEHPNEIPTFSLHPIYPNPFNNTANIAFDLPREVTGRLVVYDVLGRMTNTLYNGKLAAGSHSMQFNGNGLSSGTYFVRLETPSFSATQKAVLLK
ncbi:MAG: T9SS type A sorting domain-containing protein [bacterium]|nr:T9SS type A sorting domain-containing protein [bacterium]